MIQSMFRTALSGYLALISTLHAADETRVWIFAGLPGDEEHHQEWEKILGRMRAGFINRLGISPEHTALYYGPVSAGYAGEGSRENILAAIGEIAALTRSSPQTAHWLVFVGHAHAIQGGAQLNLPGPDLNTFDLAAALNECDPAAPLNLVFTHTASAPFLRAVGAPGRVAISATSPKDIENETEFPAAFADALHDPAADANKDGRLDAVELFQATRERVLARYGAEKLIVREAPLLDGDGDGRGTQRPAAVDALPAAERAFTLTTEGRGID